MNKKSWLIVLVVVLVAFGIYFYNSGVGLGPEYKAAEQKCNYGFLDNVVRGEKVPNKRDTSRLESCAVPPAYRSMAQGFGACDADVHPENGGDGIVNVNDLMIVLGNWNCSENKGGNETNGTISCDGEINGDGLVGATDLLIVLDNWEEECFEVLPDLIINNLDWTIGNFSNSTGNYSVDFTIEVKNIGNADVGESRTWFELVGAIINSFYTPFISPGNITFINLTGNVPSGNYTTNIVADFFDSVNESNENNNNWTSIITIP